MLRYLDVVVLVFNRPDSPVCAELSRRKQKNSEPIYARAMLRDDHGHLCRMRLGGGSICFVVFVSLDHSWVASIRAHSIVVGCSQKSMFYRTCCYWGNFSIYIKIPVFTLFWISEDVFCGMTIKEFLVQFVSGKLEEERTSGQITRIMALIRTYMKLEKLFN